MPVRSSFHSNFERILNDSSTPPYLLQTWSDLYALNASTPPKSIPLPSETVPLAPHLQACSSLRARNRRDDSRGKDGGLPSWASTHGPQPPWISGSDEDNLYLTRRAQTDLWLHHHPERCNGTTLRFLVVKWVDRFGHGLGSAFHIMSMMMSVALRYKRILVLAPGSFTRAGHAGCRGQRSNDFSCYFAPPSPPACVATALELLTEESSKWTDESFLHDLVASSAPSVEICPKCFPFMEHAAAE